KEQGLMSKIQLKVILYNTSSYNVGKSWIMSGNASYFEFFQSHEWQQLIWVIGSMSCNKYLIVAAGYFTGTSRHLLKQLPTYRSDGSTK
ncbi:hypothetical protein MKW92_044164, partial [Papaver armeniacum]